MATIAVHAFDELVLTIALPVISEKLSLANVYGLTFAAYILSAVSGMRASGAYIDALGPRRVMNFGLALFMAGTIVSAVSWSGLVFILARALQGLGGGVCITTAFALINLVPDHLERRKLITSIDFAWVIPSLAAPLIGGLLIDYLSWRAIFFIQLPVLIMVWLFFSGKLTQFDKSEASPPWSVLADALGISIGAGLSLYVLSFPPSPLWLVALVGMSMSIWCFNRAMPEQWWQGKTDLSLPLLAGLLGFTAFYGMEAFQPLYLVQGLNMSTTEAGIIVTFASFSWLAASHTAMRLYRRYPPMRIMLGGSVILFIGIVELGIVVFADLPSAGLYLGWAISGFGMGFIFNSARTSAMENAPKGKEGFVSTAITLSINMGIAASAGIGGIIKNMNTETQSDLKTVILSITAFGLVVCFTNILIISARHRNTTQAA